MVSQFTTWVSAGEPVQPTYCSSPKERTMMGSCMVPGVDLLDQDLVFLFLLIAKRVEWLVW